MEEELLQGMIRDRQTQISLLRKKLDDQAKKAERVQNHLEEVRNKLKTDTVDHQAEIAALMQRHDKIVGQSKEVTESLDMKKQQQGAQLHLYNEVMKTVATPESRDSSYVMRMQAQLCKAMHSMGMVETQLAMVTNESDGVQKYLREEITKMVEEKSQVELRLMNDLVVADNARRVVEGRKSGHITAFNKEKDHLMNKIEIQQEGGSEDGEENAEEDDEEEKEELMDILTQGREEIERMEQENKTANDKIEELKKNVMAVKGEAYVEEIISIIEAEFKDKLGLEED